VNAPHPLGIAGQFVPNQDTIAERRRSVWPAAAIGLGLLSTLVWSGFLVWAVAALLGLL
jgi:hypothetical protein